MKFSSVSTLILISSILLIAPIECHLQPQNFIIESICRTTPHYHLCVLTLKAQALIARDAAACARVMLNVMIARAPVVLERIERVLQEYNANEQPELAAALQGCSTSYTQITKEHLPKALNCINKGDYNGAKQGANTAGQLAASCENKCKTSNGGGGKGGAAPAKSPLGDSNQYLQNMCSITVAIINQLAQSKQ